MSRLPSELVSSIIQYLSPHDIAIAAQVSKAWCNIMYSNTCWKHLVIKLWEMKPESTLEFYHGLEIPSHARHIGEPSEVCFVDWLSMIIRSKHYTSIPFSVLDATDYKVYVQYFKQLWHKLNRPCIHTTHYKWYDVYRGRQYLSTMSSADQQRVFYRHCKFSVENVAMDTNPYCFWLSKHIRHSLGFAYARFDTSDIRPKSDHPADIIAAKQRTHENRRLHYLNTYRQQVLARCEASIAHLRGHSKRHFDKKSLPWDELFPCAELDDSSD